MGQPTRSVLLSFLLVTADLQVTDDLAKENVNACKDCINTAIAPVNSKADDADNLVRTHSVSHLSCINH